jgi:hypothetical protein
MRTIRIVRNVPPGVTIDQKQTIQLTNEQAVGRFAQL